MRWQERTRRGPREGGGQRGLDLALVRQARAGSPAVRPWEKPLVLESLVYKTEGDVKQAA